MSSGTAAGIVTAILLIAFLCVAAWAWSRRRKKDFDAAAQLPLRDHDGDER
jgi:cytochrome c oxidase cbb3-type subunit 4